MEFFFKIQLIHFVFNEQILTCNLKISNMASPFLAFIWNKKLTKNMFPLIFKVLKKNF